MTISPFEEEFNARTQKRRRDLRGRLLMGAVALQLNKVNSDTYRVAYIETLPLLRNTGYATVAMYWLCKLADAYNVRLELCPVALDDQGLGKLKLTAWYQSFGFNRIGMQDEMMRYPNTRDFAERRYMYAAAH